MAETPTRPESEFWTRFNEAASPTVQPTYRELYNLHVHRALHYERLANQEADKYKKWLRETNPEASEEWLDQQTGDSHYFKVAANKQQFHYRQATMYGLGAIMEALTGR